MKKSFLLIIISFVILSCSSDSSENYADCIDSATLDNEFMYQCQKYKTEAGRVKIGSPSSFLTTSCMLNLVNAEYSDWVFHEGDDHINAVNIWFSVPASCYTSHELPEGIYLNRESNDDPSTLDIVTLTTVTKNTSLYIPEGSSSLYYSDFIIAQPESYEAAEVTVDKLPSGEYEINYYFDAEGKKIKGHFKGPLPFVGWNN